jgi:hypothetical protein
VTSDRFRQRQRARLAAIFVVSGALISSLTLEHAAATVTTSEPEVQIGESLSVERAEPTPTTITNASQSAHIDDAATPGVAVAGVAIARAAPLPHRLDTDIADGGTNPLPLLIALGAEAAMIATLWHRSRRAIL